jgi:hypothetical protein
MEKPEICKESQYVWLWDEEKQKWVRGYRNDVSKLPDAYELQWTNTGANTNVAPDKDLEIDVERAKSVAIQADTTPDGNTSSSIDINVHCQLGTGIWDTTPYAEMNLGDNEIKTMLVEPGPFKIRLRVDNNIGASTGYVKVIVKVRE